MPEFQQTPDVVDVDFHRKTADTFYRMGSVARGINPARIERIHEEIRFDDLVADVDGQTGDKIHCPFHGRDSAPSFFTRGGFGFCFGCPVGEQYYDQIRFVQKRMGISWFQALRWIEKEYDLPPMPDVVIEAEDEDEITTEVYLPDLVEPFISKALRDYGTTGDEGLFEEYALIYFTALEQENGAKEARKAKEYEESARLRNTAALRLARVLGQQVVNSILDAKEQF